ncbi:MAG: nicotinate (nicotinamide) nucleotide adenylyltransferase [Planctomycetes bacterium]|nr:nicotinate (nicotinamide) nucleotide adenylyltransferase [Planctomycetota bacterium]
MGSVPLSAEARRARRLGVLGGSFDPPHLGHLHAARRAREAFALEHVVFVPAARPPHKPERILAEAEERLQMLSLLLADEREVSLWDTELTRNGPSYTVDTLRELRTLVPAETRLFLIVGEDNLAGFPRWREAEEIVRLAQPIVVHRVGAAEAFDAGAFSPAARPRLALGLLASPALAVSSTELRAALARGESCDAHFPPALGAHVARRGLYRRP